MNHIHAIRRFRPRPALVVMGLAGAALAQAQVTITPRDWTVAAGETVIFQAQLLQEAGGEQKIVAALESKA